jgi:hypothetical protein
MASAPETSEKDKAIKALEAKVKRLESAEPDIQIVFTDADGEGAKVLEGERTIYDPLTASEISELLDRIKQHFPLVTDFSAPPQTARAIRLQGDAT